VLKIYLYQSKTVKVLKGELQKILIKMLLTIIFIIYTVIKTRREPACKAYIRKISKKYINHCSVLFSPMLCTGNFSHICMYSKFYCVFY